MIIDINQAKNKYTDAVHKYVEESGELEEIMRAIDEAIKARESVLYYPLSNEQKYILKVYGYNVSSDVIGLNGLRDAISGWVNNDD